MHSLQMCIRKISGFVLLWGLTCSSLLRSQIFYVYRPRPPAFRYVPIVRGSGVSEQGVPLFAGLSCVSLVSWPDRIELALRTAAGTAYAMLPGGPAGTMCSESLWVANPELPLLCLPGPYQNVGAQEQRGLCSGVRDLAGHRLMAPAVGRFQLPFTGWKSHNPR